MCLPISRIVVSRSPFRFLYTFPGRCKHPVVRTITGSAKHNRPRQGCTLHYSYTIPVQLESHSARRERKERKIVLDIIEAGGNSLRFPLPVSHSPLREHTFFDCGASHKFVSKTFMKKPASEGVTVNPKPRRS
jgi:hypothetical protein